LKRPFLEVGPRTGRKTRKDQLLKPFSRRKGVEEKNFGGARERGGGDAIQRSITRGKGIRQTPPRQNVKSWKERKTYDIVTAGFCL